MYAAIPAGRLDQCLADAAASPLSCGARDYPRWYLRRWHYLPEGYLSRRSAALYEALVPRAYNAGREHAVIGRVVQAVAATDPSSVLEIGCGPGHLLGALTGAIPGATLTGVDLSPFMLELAAGDPRITETGRVTLHHGDARALPWDDATFDAVVAMHVAAHVPRIVAHAVVAEAARLLRPGGALFLADHCWHRAPAHPRLVEAGCARVPPGIVRVIRYQKRA